MPKKKTSWADQMAAQIGALSSASSNPSIPSQLFPKAKPVISRKAALAAAPKPRAGQGVLSAGSPDWRGSLSQKASSLGALVGLDEKDTYQAAQGALSVLDFVPGIGDAATGADAIQAGRKGNYAEAGALSLATALGMIPGAGDLAAKGIKKGANKLSRRAATAADFTPENIGSINDLDDWAIVTASNPMAKQKSAKANAKANALLKADLEAEGYELIPTYGKYDNEEEGFAVLGIPEDRARHFGNKYKQDSVLTHKGIVYHNGKIHPSKGVNTFTDRPDNYFTEMPNGARFASDIDWDNPIYPEVTADGVLSAAANKKGPTFADWRAQNDSGPGELFDYSNLSQVPDVPQVPMDRTIPPRGPSERIQGALADPRVAEGINSYVKRGAELGGKDWYNTEPFRQEYVKRLGEEEGQKAYSEFMDAVAATSPRSTVQDNIRTASYYNYLRQNGMPVNEKPAPGYGSVAQTLHAGNMEKIVNGNGWDIYANPKPASFSTNLQGNQANATIDTHNFRLPGILSQDPRFLETSIQEQTDSVEAGKALLAKQYPGLPTQIIDSAVKPGKGDKAKITYRPQQWVNEGFIPMDQAVNDPALWTAKPNANEYGFYEDWQRQQADSMGMTPAQYQASMWVGAGDATGLASPPEPFLRTLESRIKYTADKMGTTPEHVMDALVRGKAPLLSVGGAGLLGVGALSRGMEQPTEEQPYL